MQEPEGQRQEDQALHDVAKPLQKDLAVTEQLNKIARLYQRSTWPGERAAAAGAFARVARGNSWEGISPEQFLSGERRPKSELVKQPEPETQGQPPRDQHDTASGRPKPTRQPAGQNQNEAANWSSLVAFFALAAVAAGAALRHAPERNPAQPAAQTPSSGPQASAVLSDDIAPLTPKKIIAAEPEAPIQTFTPAAPEATPPASPAPLTPERQAELTVYRLTAIENSGSPNDLSPYYSDTINYYGKPTAKSGVVADKIRFMRRWPNRSYTIRPESLIVACDIMRCTADGMIDFDVSNAGKRSTGTASFTYHMRMKHNNSEPSDFLVIAENSTVISRTVTDISQMPEQTVAAPWLADRVRGR
jgi:hypothetical protein